jgi:nitroreductase
MNMQEIDLYVAMPEGVYLYEAVPHKLTPVATRDIRPIASRRPEWAKAPVILIYVADTDKRPAPRPQGTPPGTPPGAPPSGTPPQSQQPPAGVPPPGTMPSFGEVDCGFIGQNVYMFCASEKLATCFHGTDKEGLAKAMNLREAQKVLYAQTVGYPDEQKK